MKRIFTISIDTVDDATIEAALSDIIGYFAAGGLAANVVTTVSNLTLVSVTDIPKEDLVVQPDQQADPVEPEVCATDIAPVEIPPESQAEVPQTDDISALPVEDTGVATSAGRFFCYRLKTFFDVIIDQDCESPTVYVDGLEFINGDTIAVRLQNTVTTFTVNSGLLHSFDQTAMTAQISLFLSTTNVDTAEVMVNVVIADGVDTFPGSIRMSKETFDASLQPILNTEVNQVPVANTY